MARRFSIRGAVRRVAVALSLAVAVAACQQAPVTGRQQLILLPESQDAQMGLQAYQEIKQASKISRDSELNRRVQRVGKRIAKVSPHPEWDWEFTV
jgi:predicted Zn-dependent protease